MKTQTKEVLNYLQNNKRGLTQKEAIEKFGAYRLSAIIHNLRKDYLIDGIAETVPTRYKTSKGKIRTSNITRYVLSPYTSNHIKMLKNG